MGQSELASLFLLTQGNTFKVKTIPFVVLKTYKKIPL